MYWCIQNFKKHLKLHEQWSCPWKLQCLNSFLRNHSEKTYLTNWCRTYWVLMLLRSCRPAKKCKQWFLVLLPPAIHCTTQSRCILQASSAVIWTHPSLLSTQSLHPHSSQHDRDRSTLSRDPEPETEMTDHRGLKQAFTISEGNVSQCQSRHNNVSAAQYLDCDRL